MMEAQVYVQLKDVMGVSIVQSLLDAQYPEMPENAAQAVLPDFCIAAEQMPSVLIELVASKIEKILEQEVGQLKLN